MRPRLSWMSGFALVVAATLAAACGGDGAAGSDPGGDGGGERFRVVASTAVIGEFAERIAGPDAEVRTLIPPGVDLHSFEPTTGVARDIAEADLVLVNGYRLEQSLLDVIEENVEQPSWIVEVSTGLQVADGDPHLWLSVPNAIGYVEAIRDALATRDEAHATGYRDRAAALVEELEALDAEVRSILEGLAPEQRRLVVFHDAFGYLAAEYGFELVASVVPANPNQDPSAAAVVEVIAAVKERGVPTVFREPQFSSAVLDLVAEEAGVEVVDLHSTFGDDIGTYAELMRTNARALLDGLAR